MGRKVRRMTAHRYDDLRAQVLARSSTRKSRRARSPDRRQLVDRLDTEFTRRLAERGWVGMTVPRGRIRRPRTRTPGAVRHHRGTARRRAPRSPHWIAPAGESHRRCSSSARKPAGTAAWDRLRHGLFRHRNERTRRRQRPRRGTHPRHQVDGGWELTGTKVWTSGAHRALLHRAGPHPREDGRLTNTPSSSSICAGPASP